MNELVKGYFIIVGFLYVLNIGLMYQDAQYNGWFAFNGIADAIAVFIWPFCLASIGIAFSGRRKIK